MRGKFFCSELRFGSGRWWGSGATVADRIIRGFCCESGFGGGANIVVCFDRMLSLMSYVP